MTSHAAQRCKTRKLKRTLCGRVGVAYTHKSNGRIYVRGPRGRFKIAGTGDPIGCGLCLARASGR